MPSTKSPGGANVLPRLPKSFKVRGKTYHLVIPATPPIARLSNRQIVTRMESGAKRLRGVSARELVRQFRSKRLKEPCEVMRVLSLGFLLPEDHPLHVALDER